MCTLSEWSWLTWWTWSKTRTGAYWKIAFFVMYRFSSVIRHNPSSPSSRVFPCYVNVPHLTRWSLTSRETFVRSASFNLENFAVGHLPMLRLVAKRVTEGVGNAGAFTYITRISEPSFNRFPIRGNIIFGPTPSFVLRPSLLLVMLQQTDFSISSVAFTGFATRRKILYSNYLVMILLLYFDLLLFYCIFCVRMGFLDGFNFQTGSLGWRELIVSIFTHRKPFMDVIHDHGRKIVSTVERITIEPESWTINVQLWSLTMTQ